MLRPSVLHPVSLPDFLRHLIDHHEAPTSLVVCSSRAAFEQHLLHCLEHGSNSAPLTPQEAQPAALGLADQQQDSPPPPAVSDELLIPTLHNLFTTSTIRLTFCASLETLRAHLSLLSANAPNRPASPSLGSNRNSGTHPVLAILSPIALHKETTSFSAQGLSRTLAIAVEAAAHRRQKLIIAECAVPYHLRQRENDGWTDEERGALGADVMLDAEGLEAPGEEAVASREEATGAQSGEDVRMGGAATEMEDPWEEKLSILNVTTKSFGIGDRGWAGRTVSARTVAERWCRFESPW